MLADPKPKEAALSKIEIARDLCVELIRKSGVREWEDMKARRAIARAAADMAKVIMEKTNDG